MTYQSRSRPRMWRLVLLLQTPHRRHTFTLITLLWLVWLVMLAL